MPYTDGRINGFSLTHLSGTGCPSYQDVPILPTEGDIGNSPQTTLASFSHGQEQASPGRYQVRLAPTSIAVALAVTTRTGIARFAFPSGTQSNILFKVADSANPVSASSVRIVGRDQVEGQVTSGGFCQTGTNYTLHFVALFNRPFSSAGSWTGSGAAAGRTSCVGTSCGAFVSFDTTTQRDVVMKVGISFVSTHDAQQNLATEDPGWSLSRVSARGHARWNALLGRVAARGATAAQEHTFYTALYHSLLFPNIVSDVNGQYAGSDGRVHTARGRDEYANFSEWDIYRSAVQLESLLDPHDVGDMVQSLVDDAQQTGWLPKWAIVGGDESQVNGDSADPIIADAYAMGVRNFDVAAALNAMVKGATQSETGHGLEIERQYLDQYLSQHYVNAGSLDLTSIDYSIGGSVTLEYAIDDFSIARVASALGDSALAATMMRRGANWEYLFNPATGYVQARGSDGSFPPGQAFEASQFEPGGQLGFEEGNAVQYTWSVPQDLAALASLMGGDAAAASKLTTFFTSLNASRYAPYDWSGNEPSEWAPWEFDSFGAPDQTQGAVRSIVERRIRRRAGRRARQRRPGGAFLVVRVGGPGVLPRDPRLGEPGARQPALPFRDPHVARWPPPRRARSGCGGHPALCPRPHRGRGAPARTGPCRHRLLGVEHVRARRREPRLGPSLASGVGPAHRSHPVLHAGVQPRPDLGVVAGRQPAVVRHRAAPCRRVLAAERGDVGDHRADHGCRDRCGPGGSGTDHGPLAGGTASERARGLPIVGNAGARAQLRVPAPCHPVTDRDRHHRRVLLASGGDDRCRGRGTPSGRARRRGAALKYGRHGSWPGAAQRRDRNPGLDQHRLGPAGWSAGRPGLLLATCAKSFGI